MTSFEEQFPSLKGKIGEDDFGGLAAVNPLLYIALDDVKELCLDKQRVREAIEQIAEMEEWRKEEELKLFGDTTELRINTFTCAEFLKKKLGL